MLNGIGRGVDVDIYISDINTTPYYNTSNFGSYENGGEAVSLVLCPKEGKKVLEKF